MVTLCTLLKKNKPRLYNISKKPFQLVIWNGLFLFMTSFIILNTKNLETDGFTPEEIWNPIEDFDMEKI